MVMRSFKLKGCCPRIYLGFCCAKYHFSSLDSKAYGGQSSAYLAALITLAFCISMPQISKLVVYSATVGIKVHQIYCSI